MGMSLCNTNDEHLYLTHAEWSRALKTASEHGWKPRGTDPPELVELGGPAERWSGTYFSNGSQVVVAEDAAAISAALERAPEKDELKAVIDFCRRGAFAIY